MSKLEELRLNIATCLKSAISQQGQRVTWQRKSLPLPER